MMRSLLLKNWRTHENNFLEFGRGTNLIIGIMGSGKSAVLDAICYALFGTFPAAKRREVSIEDSIRWGANEAEIRLAFSISGKEYEAVRKFRRDGNKISVSARLYCNGEVSETGQARVSEAISVALGIDYELFTRAVYSEQNNIDYFLTIDPARRKKEMDRLLGLDRFEDARASAVTVLNRVSSEADALSLSFDQAEYSSLLREIGEKKERLASLSSQKKAIESELEKLSKAREAARRESVAMEDARKRLEESRRSFERAKARAETLSAELSGKSPSEEKFRRLSERHEAIKRQKEGLKAQASALERKYLLAQNSLGRLNSRIEDAISSAEAAKKYEIELTYALSGSNIKELGALAESKEREILSLASKKEALLREIEEIQETISRLKPDHAHCPLCGSEISEEKRRLIHKEKNALVGQKANEIRLLEAAIPLLEKERAELLERRRTAELMHMKIAESGERTASLSGMQAEKSRLDAEMAGLAKQISDLRLSIEKTEEEQSSLLISLREEEELLKKDKLLRAANEERANAERILSSVSFREEDLQRAREALEKASIAHERASSSLHIVEKESSSVSEVVSLMERRLSQMEKARSECLWLSRLREELTAYKNALLETQAELRTEMAGAITSAMNEIWPVLYPYADYRQLRIIATEKDYFFEVYDTEWKALEKIASGGEKACLSLTLRMALSTVLTPSLGWMMLDEPTHNLDAEAVYTLSEALESKVPQIIPQSFVITHEENLISSEFARTYRFSRDKEKGGPTLVEQL
ncbi:MAG: SMC family ATPase [Candidatus Bilamarchaeaceae archaeon]